MKKYYKERFTPRIRRTMVNAASVTLLLALTACGGSGDSGDDGGQGGDVIPGGGGIFGTGIQLDGTVSSQYQLASNSVEFKRQSGETGSESVRTNGTFAASEVPGSGAVLLRTSIVNGEPLYALAVPGEAERVNQNIHSYSDLVARNWFASNGQDIDAAFNGSGELSPVPTATTLRSLEQSVTQIYSGVQDDYDLGGSNIFNDEFVANGSGIDGFLVNNPVIINNGTINIFFVDPSTNVQSQAASGLNVNNNLLDVDTQNPTAPSDVRALPAASNEILVVWNPATDNVAVTHYDIYRNGELVGTTAFQVFSDIPLTAGTQYTYTVVAVDSSGNESDESLAATAETLGQPDSEAPLAATNFSLQPALGSISLSWSHPNNDDVASYTIRRSVGTGALSDYLASTSLSVTDANVVGGTEYCYQVVALDGSANESAPTEVLCTTTEGEAITGTQPPVVDQPEVMDPAMFDAPLVDVTGMACTAEIEERIIEDNTTLEAGCYLVTTGDLVVQEDANLTLNPGVVLKFGANRELEVQSGGSLTAEGTASNPIVLTAIDPTPGFWQGVEYRFANSSRNRLKYVQIEYGGSGNSTQSNLEITASTSSPSRLSISNSTLRHSAGYGFDAERGSVIDEFTSVQIIENDSALLLDPNDLGSMTAPLLIAGNGSDEFELTLATIEEAITLADYGVPYRVPGMNVRASVEITANTVVRVASGQGITVEGNSGGSLKITGTPEQPVIVTGVDPSSGSWDGINYRFSNSANNVITNAVIEYGGSGSNGANIELTSTTSSPSRIALNNVSLNNALNFGFAFGSGSIISGFDGVISSGNGATGRVALSSVGGLSGSAALTGNTLDQISVTGSAMNNEQAWVTHDVPYFIEDGIIAAAGLTLSPGSTLIFDSGQELRLQENGYLNAQGLAAAPITFTGAETIAGYWEGLIFRFSGSTLNVLDNVVVQYAGVGPVANNGNVEMVCTTSSPARLSISNAQILDSSSWGMFLSPNGCDLTLGANVTFARNASGDINVP